MSSVSFASPISDPVQPTFAHLDDLPEIMRLQSLCYHAIEPESIQSMQSKITISPDSCFVVKHNGTLLAYLLSIPALLQVPPALDEETHQLPDRPDCLYLHDLAIHPIARKNGISQKLVQAFLHTAKKKNLSYGSLIAIQDSVPFWKKQGFSPIIPNDSLQKKLQTYGSHATYMERRI